MSIYDARSLVLLAGLVLATPTGALGQQPLQLDYSFVNPVFGRTAGALHLLDGEQSGSFDTQIVDDFRLDVTAIISADASQVTFLFSEIDLLPSTSATVSGEFDLGFTGIIPYSVTYTDARVLLDSLTADLTPDLRLENIPSSGSNLVSAAGTVDFNGQITAFSFQDVPFSGRAIGAGQFFLLGPGGSTVEMEVQIRLFAQPDEGAILASSSVGPFLLELGLRFGLGRGIGGSLLRSTTSATPASDSDSDGIVDVADNCPQAPNPGQTDTDGNGLGDACNDSEDADGDEYADNLDNCPNDPNPGQEDRDFDGVGDACDPFPDDPNNALAQCEADLAQCLADPNGNQCGQDLAQCNQDRSQLAADLGLCEVDLGQCLAAMPFTDTDGDGEEDMTDSCPGTATGVEVDDAGCSQEQFCALTDASVKGGRRACKKSDWKNDEPVMKGRDRDCEVDKGGAGREDDRCVPAP